VPARARRRRVPPERLISQLPSGRCSIKDSFADLDLTPYGFQPLFEATWISRVAPVRAGPGNGWAIVSEPEEVDSWLQACGLGDVLTVAFARDPSVRVAQFKPAGRVLAGGVLNGTGSVVGLSNVFSLDGSLNPWEELTALCSEVFPGRPIVGYERADDLKAAIMSGFEPVGALIVWQQVR